LVGSVYRNKDGTKPADAIVKLKSQLRGCESLTVSQWVVSKKAKSSEGSKTHVLNDTSVDAVISEFQARFETSSNEDEVELVIRQIQSMRFSKDHWIKLSQALTGINAKSGKAAQQAIRVHFGNRRQLKNRRENIAKVLQ
jgi:hypothetical protein